MYRVYVENEVREWDLVASFPEYLEVYQFTRQYVNNPYACWKVLRDDRNVMAG